MDQINDNLLNILIKETSSFKSLHVILYRPHHSFIGKSQFP